MIYPVPKNLVPETSLLPLSTNNQLQLGHIRRLKDEVDIVARGLKKTIAEADLVENQVDSALRRKATLESDLARLAKVDTEVRIDSNVLAALDAPFDYELNMVVDWDEKMTKLRDALHGLLQLTVANYRTAMREQGDQEEEFAQKIGDALSARNLLTDELRDVQGKTDHFIWERCKLYNEINVLEAQLAACEAEMWLCRCDSNRLADQLAMLSKEMPTRPCQCAQPKHIEHERKTTTENETLVVSTSHEHQEQRNTETLAIPNSRHFSENIVNTISNVLADLGIDAEF